jgi:hypothetical protein
MATKRNSVPKPPKKDNYRVRIRMYRQGLGDCFLLSFPKGKGKHAHLMIDCGVVLGTTDPGKVMTKVAEDIKKTTDGKLDVLVITHEHWDHLSGFDKNQARSVFADKKFKIDKLWLAWTEAQTGLAQSLREEREQKKKAAKMAKERAKERGMHAQAKRLAALLGFFGADALGAGDDEEGEAGGGTAGALEFLKEKCDPTLVDTGDSFLFPGLKGVRVYVVAPPMDAAAMKKTNPYKGEGYALADPPIGLTEAFLAAFDPSDERAQPFARELRRQLSELKPSKPSNAPVMSPNQTSQGIADYYQPALQWRNIDDAWLATGGRLALQLDSATNNTSLVLAIELGGEDVLLFVGDAQAGNWRSWEKRTWKVKDGSGETREVTSTDLLRRTIFYKVGHHGSHNATLREKGLELMKSDRLAAFIPVDTEVAHDVKGWTHMPLPAIQKRLKDKCAVVFQSDTGTTQIKDVPGAYWEESNEKFEVFRKNKVTKKVEFVRNQPLYTDYFV